MNKRVFNFKENWHKVIPYLSDSLVLRALNAGMVSLCDKHQDVWDPSNGPWTLTDGDYWFNRTEEKYREAGGDEAMLKWVTCKGCPSYKENPLWHDIWHEINRDTWTDEYLRHIAKHSPHPETLDWYCCFGGCHWIVAWNCALGNLIFPHMDWKIIKGYNHSTAVGTSKDDCVFMDILWFDQAGHEEIWKDANTAECKTTTLLEEIEWLETRPYLATCPFCGSKDVEVSHHKSPVTYKEILHYSHIIITECMSCGTIDTEASSNT